MTTDAADQKAPPDDAAAIAQAEAQSRATLRTAVLAVGACAVVLTIGLGIALGPLTALSVGCGGALATANLYVFTRVGRELMVGGRRARIWTLVGILKFAVLVGVVYLLLRSGAVGPLGLALGYGALPLGIVIGNVVAARPGER